MCIININIYHVHMGLCRKVEKWFDGLNFGFSHLHDYLGLHDYPGLKSMPEVVDSTKPNCLQTCHIFLKTTHNLVHFGVKIGFIRVPS